MKKLSCNVEGCALVFEGGGYRAAYTAGIARVLLEQGIHFPFVCGNDQGGFYPHGYPSEFTGVNAGRCGCFARIAAKHACGIA